MPGKLRSLVGTVAGYQSCPECGHARVKHLSPPAGGCTAATWAAGPENHSPVPASPGMCGCTLTNRFPAREGS